VENLRHKKLICNLKSYRFEFFFSWLTKINIYLDENQQLVMLLQLRWKYNFSSFSNSPFLTPQKREMREKEKETNKIPTSYGTFSLLQF